VSSHDSIGRIIRVALALCIVCSVVVSTAAVMLKPAQEANKDSIASAISSPPRECSKRARASRSCSQRSGRATWICAPGASPRSRPRGLRAARRGQGCRPCRRTSVDDDEDIAKIGRRANYALVYLVNGENGAPIEGHPAVHGYGLWSTLYGFRRPGVRRQHDRRSGLL
jgi:Na+-transporting NADH:ubiquinone oxidoreductase subunit C